MGTPVAVSPLPLHTESEILAERPAGVVIGRFAPNPRITVIDFPSLLAQGLAFNRIAAFVEKLGLPHDRVLTDPELAAAIQADNATAETYYYGHDYRLADVRRFFTTAAREGIALGRDERQLHDLLDQHGLLAPGTGGAVISIPREGSDPFVDASGRASLLRHELSHGEYFTNPAYAAFSKYFWTTEMTKSDRASFREFLTRQGYDPKNEDLLINETQAHLMHTTDGRYFNARSCGLPVARVEQLRAAFLAMMPAGWLHDAAQSVRAALP